MEIGSTNTFAAPAQQNKPRADDVTQTSSREIQNNPGNEQQSALQQPAQQERTEPRAVREAILSLGEAEPTKSNEELFRERAAGNDVNDTRLEPQSITELATSAFEQRQAEKTEDRTREQAELREQFTTEDNNSTSERFVDVNV